MAPALEIRLFGGFEILYGGEPLVEGFTSRVQSLLAYLLLNRQSPQSRQHIAFLFWPDSTESQAKSNLRHLIFNLREALPEAERFIQVEQHALRWIESGLYVFDVDEFEIVAGSSGDLEALERAVKLYGGDLLPGFYEDWIITERGRLRELYLQALESQVAMLENLRRYSEAIQAARQIVRHDPLLESAYRDLMRLHALDGDRAGALRVYHACSTLLQRELGVEPAAETQVLYDRLLSRESSASEPSHPAMISSPMVGRQQSWKWLLDAWKKLQPGEMRFVLIAGEAGIGKTRLAEELLSWASRQAIPVASAYCYANQRELGYAPLTAWLRELPLPDLEGVWLSEIARLLPEILARRPEVNPPPPLHESWQRQRLFEALARAVQAGAGERILLLEDLQWSDRETLEWLYYFFTRKPAAGPLLVIGTLRREEAPPESELQDFFVDLKRRNLLDEIELQRLTRDETGELVGRLQGGEVNAHRAAAVFRETEGNPLFIVESVRAGFPDTLPDRVQAVIEARLQQLSPGARDLAELSAAIGREFNFPLIQAAAGMPDDALVQALDELWQKRILREQGRDGYDFSHDKIREVAYQGLSTARRRLLHSRIYRAFESRLAGELDAVSSKIAWHAEQAGAAEQAVRYYARAAAAAWRVYALPEAIFIYRHLLEGQLKAHLDPPTRLAFQLELADVYRLNSQWKPAEEVCRQALQEAQALEDILGQARGRQILGNVLRLQGYYNRALDQLKLAEDDFRSAGDLKGVVRALWTMGEIYWYQGRQSQALETLERQMQIAREIDDQEGICDAAGTMGIVYWSLGEYEKSRLLCLQSIEIAERTGHEWAIGRAEVTLGNTYVDSDHQLAHQWYRRAYKTGLRIGDSQVVNFAVDNIGNQYAMRGQNREAAACYLHSLSEELQRGDRWTASIALVNLGHVFAGLGHEAQAEALFLRSVEMARELQSNFLPLFLVELAEYFQRRERHGEAAAALEEAFQVASAYEDRDRIAGENYLARAAVLETVLAYRLGKLDALTAVRDLERQLADEEDPNIRALRHTEIWHIDSSKEEHRQEAARIYRRLYAETQDVEYRLRYEQLGQEPLPDLAPLPPLEGLEVPAELNDDELFTKVVEILKAAG